MKIETKLTSPDFLCPKCRGNKADVRDVVLNKARCFGLVPSRDNHYVEITCMLCGYTEFYNRAIYVAAQVPAPVPAPDAGVALPEKKIKLR